MENVTQNFEAGYAENSINFVQPQKYIKSFRFSDFGNQNTNFWNKQASNIVHWFVEQIVLKLQLQQLTMHCQDSFIVPYQPIKCRLCMDSCMHRQWYTTTKCHSKQWIGFAALGSVFANKVHVRWVQNFAKISTHKQAQQRYSFTRLKNGLPGNILCVTLCVWHILPDCHILKIKLPDIHTCSILVPYSYAPTLSPGPLLHLLMHKFNTT